jgi:Uma2 family endonuclease
VYALAGATERHDLIVTELAATFRAEARQRGCRLFTSNRLVRTRCGNAYYPDLTVVCSPAPDPFHETDPTLVVEVISPSTKSIDRREKAVAYAESPQLKMLLLVDQDERRIEVAHPANGHIERWEAFGPAQIAPAPFGIVNVDELYDEVDRLTGAH